MEFENLEVDSFTMICTHLTVCIPAIPPIRGTLHYATAPTLPKVFPKVCFLQTRRIF